MDYFYGVFFVPFWSFYGHGNYEMSFKITNVMFSRRKTYSRNNIKPEFSFWVKYSFKVVIVVQCLSARKYKTVLQ